MTRKKQNAMAALVHSLNVYVPITSSSPSILVDNEAARSKAKSNANGDVSGGSEGAGKGGGGGGGGYQEKLDVVFDAV